MRGCGRGGPVLVWTGQNDWKKTRLGVRGKTERARAIHSANTACCIDRRLYLLKGRLIFHGYIYIYGEVL